MRCWGNGGSGRLGTGSTDTIGDDEPASQGKVVALGGPAEQISAGAEHTCAVLKSGAVRCWGSGRDGRLGYGNKEDVGDNELPEAAGDVPVGAKVVQVAAGGRHTCALRESGAVRCWGDGSEFRLGLGGEGPADENNIGDDESVQSVPAVQFNEKVQQIAIDSARTCVLFQNGKVRCWGPIWGEDRYSSRFERPARLRPDARIGESVASLGRGRNHICAVTSKRGVRCWGMAGVPGDPMGYSDVSVIYVDPPDGSYPTPAKLGDVSGITDAVQVAGGDNHTCVLLGSGRVRCWGKARTGALGFGGPDHWGGDNTVPREASDTVRPKDGAELSFPAKARQIVAGVFFTCALLEDDTVRCWGSSESGQLGYGSKDTVWDATKAPPVPL